MITINIYDIIATFVISLQSLSFIIFIKNRDYIKRVIYSIQIFILVGIILILVDIVFFREAYFTKWYSYITLILGIYNIVRLIYIKINMSLPISVKDAIIIIFILMIFTLFMYMRISKDVYYTSWDYIAHYYPNGLRLIEKKFITPELYIPAFLYGAPEVVTSITSNLIIPNIFGSPLYFYALLIFTIVIIAKNLNRTIFILFNPLILIFYLSFLGYTEYVIIWLLTTSYYIFRHFENNDIIYFVISFWFSFFTKPYVALAFLNVILYFIIKRIFKYKYLIIVKVSVFIEILIVLVYSIGVYTLVKFSVYSIIFSLILLELMFKFLRYKVYQLKNDPAIIINNKTILYIILLSLPFILEGVYIFLQTKLFFIAPLVSPWFKEETKTWEYPIDNVAFDLYYDLNVVNLVIFLTTYIIFRKYIINSNQINILEFIYILGLLPSLFSVIDYWPREFIRRILPFYFYVTLTIMIIIKDNYKTSILNLFYLTQFLVSFISYYYHDIATSWFEVTYISFLKSVPSLLVILSILFIIIIKHSHYYDYTNLKDTLKIVMMISLILIIIIEFISIININNISYSREYLAVNYWTIELITDLSQLNSSSVLTCGFGINKAIGLRSYDFASFQQALFMYIILNKGYNLSYFNVTQIVHFDTPLGSVCIQVLNNKTIPILSEHVKYLKISR